MGVPYHLLLGARDWRPAVQDGGTDVVWDAGQGEVTLRPDLPPFEGVGPVTLAGRRGAGADPFGHLYWISQDRRQILYRPAGSREGGLFWDSADLLAPPPCPQTDFRPVAPPDPVAPELWALAATRRGYLVVGTRAPAGLLIFDLHGGGPPVWRPWPEDVPFAPFDMTADPCGGVWILDTPDSVDARLWYLDRDLNIGAPPDAAPTVLVAGDTDTFRPVGGTARTMPDVTHPAHIDLALAIPIADVTPAGIESLPDGTLLLLDQGPLTQEAFIHRLTCGASLQAPIDLLSTLRDSFPAAPGSAGHDLAFRSAPDSGQPCQPVLGTVYVAMAGGDQAFAFRLEATAETLDLVAQTDFLPMRRFAGKALVAAPCEVFYDTSDNWLPLLRLPRPRFVREGTLEAITLDSYSPGTVWHRLFLDAHIPAGDRIIVQTRAADRPEDLARAPWTPEQPLYRRAINRRITDNDTVIDEGERPYHRPYQGNALCDERTGTWEVLFQQAAGRHIQIRLTLLGSGRSSPRIRALRASYPRPSYPERFLPAAYREDPVSADFLERYLANFEGLYTELADRISAVQTLFDSRTTPPEALDWLASWLGASLDGDWDESRRRLFINHAFQLYRSRGTLRGLIWAIRLATEDCPSAGIFAQPGDGAPFGLRITEGFGGVALPAALSEAASAGPGQITRGTAWEPGQGGARLDGLWREFLQTRYAPGDDMTALPGALAEAWEAAPSSPASLRFWSQTPQDRVHASDRAGFISDAFARGYAEITTADAAAYRDYLVRKYATTEALNTAYGLTGRAVYAGFGDVPFPPADRLPADGAALFDWIGFATIDLTARRRAHRFTVLVPVKPEDSPGARQSAMERVRAVVTRERPSHTQFDVQPYWALFRTGTARVGLDTVVGEGARFTALVLGAGYLGAGLVSRGHPYTVSDRWVSGRDRPGSALG